MSWPGTVLQRWGSDRLSQHKPDNNITTFYLTEVFQLDNQTTTWKPFTYFYRQKYLCFFSHQISCRHIFLLCIFASYQMYGVKLWADVPLSFHDDIQWQKVAHSELSSEVYPAVWFWFACSVVSDDCTPRARFWFWFACSVSDDLSSCARSTRWWLVWLITSNCHLSPYSTRIHFLSIHTVSCLSDSFLK